MRSSGERGSAVLGAKGAAVGSSLVAISSRVRAPAAREERVRASPEESEQSATAGSRQQAERGARARQKWRDPGLCSSHKLSERTQPVLRSLQRGGKPARRPRADEDERGREPGSGGALDSLRACRQGSSSRTASPLSQFEPCRERARTAPGANPSARACRPRPLSRLDLLLDKPGCTAARAYSSCTPTRALAQASPAPFDLARAHRLADTASASSTDLHQAAAPDSDTDRHGPR